MKYKYPSFNHQLALLINFSGVWHDKHEILACSIWLVAVLSTLSYHNTDIIDIDEDAT
jgi:hypothetical protein